MEHLSNDHEDDPNQRENFRKLCDEAGHPILSLLESLWTLKEQLNQNLSMEGSHCRTNTSIRRKKKNPKEQVCESHSQGSE